MSPTPTNIVAYLAQVPDCVKIAILLEELGLDYEMRLVDVTKAEQKEPWYLEINPNGRVPALTDILPDGKELKLFESGSIMQYLVDRYDKNHKQVTSRASPIVLLLTYLPSVSYPAGTLENYRTASWLYFQTSGVGPMMGQAMHFTRFAPTTIEYPLYRYRTEVNRLFRTLDTALTTSTSGYLVGDRCTIADLALWPWIVSDFWAGVSVDAYPNLKKWEQLMISRPGVNNGRHKPGRHFMKELAQDPALQKTIEKAGGEWIRGLQDANAKKGNVTIGAGRL
ncbi:Glutathione S-transferase 2 [Sporothrix stenoceras]|uniref:Glutathione S-transferase 2 n=1 Tax=Sporothrix stenoceras TaxID=5173 RepID=A0ABR3ZK26_9PEZI